MNENKKRFEEPDCEILKLAVADVVTASDFIDNGNWGGGEI